MGVKLVGVEPEPHPDFARFCHDYDARQTGPYFSKLVDELLAPGVTHCSHRLIFKKPEHAFEFKLRWS